MEIWSSNITDKEYKSILKNFNDLCDNMKKKRKLYSIITMG
jgi:hypothetical protein